VSSLAQIAHRHGWVLSLECLGDDTR
jgi:hypothetical protein